MEKITLQFSSQNDLGSEAIRFFEHGIYSHVDVVFPDGTLLGARNDALAGIPSGVRIRPPTYTDFSAIKRVVIPTTLEQTKAFYGFLLDQVGKPYDETAIVAFVVGRNWRDEDAWYCSELAASAIEKASVLPYKLANSSNKLTPADLLLVASVLTNVWEQEHG